MFSCTGACLDSLLIMGFTSGLVHADSDDQYSVKIKVINEDIKTSHLPNRPGVEYLKHKGDLWTISFANDFSFTSPCVKKSDIVFIRIKANGNDDWNIETIVTFVKSGNNYELATSDFGVNSWIDGGPNQDQFELNLIL